MIKRRDSLVVLTFVESKSLVGVRHFYTTKLVHVEGGNVQTGEGHSLLFKVLHRTGILC